jgi:SPX domain protein involved in polyphosphate accumulation
MNDKPRTIDERIDALTTSMELFQHSLEDLREKQKQDDEKQQRFNDRLDRRISRLYGITLRIGADFAERLRKLELEDDEDEPESEDRNDKK